MTHLHEYICHHLHLGASCDLASSFSFSSSFFLCLVSSSFSSSCLCASLSPFLCPFPSLSWIQACLSSPWTKSCCWWGLLLQADETHHIRLVCKFDDQLHMLSFSNLWLLETLSFLTSFQWKTNFKSLVPETGMLQWWAQWQHEGGGISPLSQSETLLPTPIPPSEQNNDKISCFL